MTTAETIEITQDQPSENLVDIHEADYDDIVNFLVNDPSLADEIPATQTQENNLGQEEEPKAQDEESEEPKISKAEFDKLKAEHERTLKIAEDGKRFIGRQSQEIGQLRKSLQDTNAKLLANLDEKQLTDQQGAVEDILEIKENKKKIEELDAQENQLKKVFFTREIVSRYVKPDETSMPDMVAELKRDGVADDFIQAYQQNPFGVSSPAEIIHLAKRASMRKDIVDLMNYAKGLEKQLKNKTPEVLDRVTKALSSSVSVNGSAATSGKPVQSVQEVVGWGDDELDAFLEKARKSGK